MCDIELPYPGKFPYPGKVPYPVFLQWFIQDLILGLPYTGKVAYPKKASIRKSSYLVKSNNDHKQKLLGLNDSLYSITPFLE